MQITSYLVQGSGSAIANRLNSMASMALNALVLMCLGADHPTLLSCVRHANVQCPVYLTETYGIIGYDEEVGRNVELMEKGRGSEYGFQGGSGGRGCLVLAYSGDGVTAGHTPTFPTDASTLMVVADTSKAFAALAPNAPLHYGGITKQCWVLSADRKHLEQIPYFWIATKAGIELVGVATFTGEAAPATESLLAKIPSGWKPSGAVGLFPCFTRGENQYGTENVEVDAISRTMSSPRIYGMFAHGELGPSSFSGFASDAQKVDCHQHSMTSILAIHTAPEVRREL